MVGTRQAMTELAREVNDRTLDGRLVTLGRAHRHLLRDGVGGNQHSRQSYRPDTKEYLLQH